MGRPVILALMGGLFLIIISTLLVVHTQWEAEQALSEDGRDGQFFVCDQDPWSQPWEIAGLFGGLAAVGTIIAGGILWYRDEVEQSRRQTAPLGLKVRRAAIRLPVPAEEAPTGINRLMPYDEKGLTPLERIITR